MTMTFNSFQSFATHLGKIHFAEHLIEGLEIAANIIEHDAKEEIGTYQRDNVGPYDPWAELAASTKQDRVNQGYSENEPLLRSGAMRDSITHELDGLDAYIGSENPILLWQEFGTLTIPPRSVLGLSAFRNVNNILKLIENVSIASLIGKTIEMPLFDSSVKEGNLFNV